jgi:hypothetical protein
MSCPKASFASAFSAFLPTGGGPPCYPSAVKRSRLGRHPLLRAPPHPSRPPRGLVPAVADPGSSSRGSPRSRFGFAPWTCGVSLIRPERDPVSDLRPASARTVEVCLRPEKLTPRPPFASAAAYPGHSSGLFQPHRPRYSSIQNSPNPPKPHSNTIGGRVRRKRPRLHSNDPIESDPPNSYSSSHPKSLPPGHFR